MFQRSLNGHAYSVLLLATGLSDSQETSRPTGTSFCTIVLLPAISPYIIS